MQLEARCLKVRHVLEVVDEAPDALRRVVDGLQAASLASTVRSGRAALQQLHVAVDRRQRIPQLVDDVVEKLAQVPRRLLSLASVPATSRLCWATTTAR